MGNIADYVYSRPVHSAAAVDGSYLYLQRHICGEADVSAAHTTQSALCARSTVRCLRPSNAANRRHRDDIRRWNFYFGRTLNYRHRRTRRTQCWTNRHVDSPCICRKQWEHKSSLLCDLGRRRRPRPTQRICRQCPVRDLGIRFTHAYGSAGTYRPTFTVSNNAGSAQASASVTVGGGGFMCPGVTLVCPAGQHAVRAADSCQQSCVSDTTTSSNFSASPTSGSPPLAVHFWADVSGSEYKIDFGDGTSGNLSGGWCPPNPAMGAPCMAAGADHTYTSAGTYTARLLQKSTCAIDTTCWVPVLGASSVTVTVYGTPVNPSTGTFSPSPTSC